MKKFRFYKEEGKWYIDLPEWIEMGGSKDALEMVFGADEFLEKFNNGDNQVFLEISTIHTDLYYESLNRATNKNLESGAFYFHRENPNVMNYEDSHILWLCDVTKFIFNDSFPPIIYFKQIPELK